MAEVPFRPARQLSEYKGKGASASREPGSAAVASPLSEVSDFGQSAQTRKEIDKHV